MARLKKLLNSARRATPYHEPEVHFHSGPQSQPIVCDDPRCGAPRLDVHAL